jgi:hypothetical protein
VEVCDGPSCEHQAMTKQRYDAWVISAVFNKLFERKGFETVREASRHLHMNHSTFGRWLDGTTQAFDPPKVQGAAQRLGASYEMSQQLYDLAVQTHIASASGYRESAVPGAERTQTPFTLIEAGADRIDIFEESLVNGLLQSPEYIRAVDAADPFSTPEFAEQVERYKIERQGAIFGSRTPDMRVIINEAALLRIAQFEFYDKQVDHMLGLIERFGIGVYVLPISAGIQPATYGSFILMGFSHPVEREIAFLESYGAAGEWVGDKSTLDRFRKLFLSTLRCCVELGAYVDAFRGMAQVQS